MLGSAILLICADMVVCSLNMLRYETYRGEKSALQTAERISSRLKSLGVQKCDLRVTVGLFFQRAGVMLEASLNALPA